MTEKYWKLLKRILLIGTILAATKVIFFDYTLDEEYQIMMSYRKLKGDAYFGQMWEPHQTSAFLCTGLMWLYEKITGTFTGVVLYLRFCTTLIQLAVTFYLYRMLRHLTEEKYAFLLALVYLNVVPKIIQIPEFSNMQLWFFTLLVLLLMQYYGLAGDRWQGRPVLLVLAGISMALEVLSYPSCLILFPFFLIMIACKSRKRWRDSLIFAGTCGICAVLWLCRILSNISFTDFLRNVKYVLDFDLTHEVSGATEGKLQGILSNLADGAGLLILIMVCSGFLFLLWKKISRRGACERRESILVFTVLSVVSSEIMQLVFWVILRSGYEVVQIHLLMLLFAGAVSWRYAGPEKKKLVMGLVGSLFSYGAVIYISDLEMYYALPHGLIGPLFCALLLVWALHREMGESARPWAMLLLVSLCLTTIFGKGFTLRDGRDYNTVLETRGIMKYGPAAGILSDYMCAYIYNSNYENFQEYTEEGEKVLIVTNMVFSAGTTPYMFRDLEVCHYSIVDPTAYDERLLTYWELYPEKRPDVIVVDCWYGQLQEPADGWIMQYIEGEFGYTHVNDGKYVRFYRR